MCGSVRDLVVFSHTVSGTEDDTTEVDGVEHFLRQKSEPPKINCLDFLTRCPKLYLTNCVENSKENLSNQCWNFKRGKEYSAFFKFLK